jgi:tetrahydromethanopterin S-methyltransferase subunit F
MTDDPLPRSAEVLAQKIADAEQVAPGVTADPNEVKKLTEEAVKEVDAVTRQSAQQVAVNADARVYIIAVRSLGITAVGVVFAILLIAVLQNYTTLHALLFAQPPAAASPTSFTLQIPDGLVALGSAAIGALAGLLGPLSARA